MSLDHSNRGGLRVLLDCENVAKTTSSCLPSCLFGAHRVWGYPNLSASCLLVCLDHQTRLSQTHASVEEINANLFWNAFKCIVFRIKLRNAAPQWKHLYIFLSFQKGGGHMYKKGGNCRKKSQKGGGGGTGRVCPPPPKSATGSPIKSDWFMNSTSITCSVLCWSRFGWWGIWSIQKNTNLSDNFISTATQ